MATSFKITPYEVAEAYGDPFVSKIVASYEAGSRSEYKKISDAIVNDMISPSIKKDDNWMMVSMKRGSKGIIYNHIYAGAGNIHNIFAGKTQEENDPIGIKYRIQFDSDDRFLAVPIIIEEICRAIHIYQPITPSLRFDFKIYLRDDGQCGKTFDVIINELEIFYYLRDVMIKDIYDRFFLENIRPLTCKMLYPQNLISLAPILYKQDYSPSQAELETYTSNYNGLKLEYLIKSYYTYDFSFRDENFDVPLSALDNYSGFGPEFRKNLMNIIKPFIDDNKSDLKIFEAIFNKLVKTGIKKIEDQSGQTSQEEKIGSQFIKIINNPTLVPHWDRPGIKLL